MLRIEIDIQLRDSAGLSPASLIRWQVQRYVIFCLFHSKEFFVDEKTTECGEQTLAFAGLFAAFLIIYMYRL